MLKSLYSLLHYSPVPEHGSMHLNVEMHNEMENVLQKYI